MSEPKRPLETNSEKPPDGAGDADAMLADTDRRRRLEAELLARGMTPPEIQRLLNASSRTYDADLLPLPVPEAALPPAAASLPPASVSRKPDPKNAKARSQSVQSEMIQLAQQLQEKKTEIQEAAIVEASRDFPPFRESSLPEKIESESLQRDANLARKRGLYSEAEAKCRAALDLAPKDAGALELLGDIAQGVGRVDEALAAYRRAVQADSRRASAERKYGELITQQQNFEQYDPEAATRNPFVAVLLSALIPGAGQIYNGETGKGIFFLSVTALFTYLLGWSAFGFTGRHRGGGFGNLSMLIVFALVTYIVCMTDAQLTAKKAQNSP